MVKPITLKARHRFGTERREIPLALIVAMSFGICVGCKQALAEVLYATGFEYSEGFDSAYELPWQGGWVGEPYDDSPGAINSSGIISNAVAPPSQQAYVGYFAPNPRSSFVSVWRPVNFVPTNQPIVQFDVFMNITASSSLTNADNFRWSVYNMEGQRLFTVDFDNYYTDVSYFLDGDNPVTIVTSQRFTNDVPFWFSLEMDFGLNQWSAAVDGINFVSRQPITTVGSDLTLGDVDAVWAIYDPDNPGDNFMTFDDYSITSLPAGTASAWLEVLATDGTAMSLRLHGPDDYRYAIETSTNLVDWLPLKTNMVSAGSFDLVHLGAEPSDIRVYRARFVP